MIDYVTPTFYKFIFISQALKKIVGKYSSAFLLHTLASGAVHFSALVVVVLILEFLFHRAELIFEFPWSLDKGSYKLI